MTPSPAGRVLVDLPVTDLNKPDGGAWNLKGRVNWKKSEVDTFQKEPALRVFYGKGSGTSKDPGVGGMGFCSVPRGLPGNDAIVSFDMFFDRGWNFSRGGKVAGFHIGTGQASGYRHSDDGASHRLMWQKDGACISYIYPPTNLKQKDPELKAEGHGIGYFKDVFKAGTLKIGEWNQITIGVKMNSFRPDGKPNADGVALLTINGKTCLKEDIRWSKSPKLNITSFDFGTFFGGPDPSLVDCTAFYRNFKLLDWKR